MAASYMIMVINNNRKLLSQRDKLRNVPSSYSNDKKTEYDLPKATSKQLKEIAKRLKKERKIRMAKVVIVTIVLFLILLIAFMNSTEGIIELLSY